MPARFGSNLWAVPLLLVVTLAMPPASKQPMSQDDKRELLRFMYQTTAKGNGKSFQDWLAAWRQCMSLSSRVSANSLEGHSDSSRFSSRFWTVVVFFQKCDATILLLSLLPSASHWLPKDTSSGMKLPVIGDGLTLHGLRSGSRLLVKHMMLAALAAEKEAEQKVLTVALQRPELRWLWRKLLCGLQSWLLQVLRLPSLLHLLWPMMGCHDLLSCPRPGLVLSMLHQAQQQKVYLCHRPLKPLLSGKVQYLHSRPKKGNQRNVERLHNPKRRKKLMTNDQHRYVKKKSGHLVKLAVIFSERFAFTISRYFVLVPSILVILVSHLRCYWADGSFSLFHWCCEGLDTLQCSCFHRFGRIRDGCHGQGNPRSFGAVAQSLG